MTAPTPPTGAAEAFGDASSIAAQGRQVLRHRRSSSTPAHPLPAGCNITVRGMAPGASLIGMKVFGNSNYAPSTRRSSRRWTTRSTVDHADVLSESFGENPIPDTAQDLTRAVQRRRPSRPASPWSRAPATPASSDRSARPPATPVIAAGAHHDVPRLRPGRRTRLPVRKRQLAERQHLARSSRRLHPGRPHARPGGAGRAGLGAVQHRPRRCTSECTNFTGAPVADPAVRRHQRVGAADRGRAPRWSSRPTAQTHARAHPSPALVKPAAHEHRDRPGHPELRAGRRRGRHAGRACRPPRCRPRRQRPPGRTGNKLILSSATQRRRSGPRGLGPTP